VPHSISLVNFQLDTQNSYLFIYNTFIKILFMFRTLLCSSSGGLRRNCIYAVSGIVTLCRWLSCAPVKKELSNVHTIHLLKSFTCFEHSSAHLQEVYVVIVYMQPLVSSLSADDCPVHRLRKNSFFLNRCTGQSPTESDDTRDCINTITT
jgi:hypothetical protein